jgi:hypothetical protein
VNIGITLKVKKLVRKVQKNHNASYKASFNNLMINKMKGRVEGG